MGKKSSKAPDYKGAAEATAKAESEAADKQTWANRANQYGPEGSLEWSAASMVDPSTGKPITQWTQNVKLSPEQQRIFDLNQQVQTKRMQVGNTAADRLASEYGKPIDWSGMNAWGKAYDPTGKQGNTTGGTNPWVLANSGQPGDPNAFRLHGENAAYQSQMRRIDPQYQQQRDAMEQQMRNQGLNPDDRAWQNQMRAMSESYNDAAQSARLSSAEAGRAESALNWGQGQDRVSNKRADTALNQNYLTGNRSIDAQLEAERGRRAMAQQSQGFEQANALRQMQMAEAMQKRGFNLNEINAMTSGQQVGMPQFGGYNTAGRGGAADYLGAETAKGNFEQGQNQGFWGGIGSLANTGVKAYSAGMFG